MDIQHFSDKLDDFLEEGGLLAEAEAIATKREIAFQVSRLSMKRIDHAFNLGESGGKTIISRRKTVNGKLMGFGDL